MRLPRQPDRPLRWPAFLYTFGVLFWSAALCGLLYKIRWLQFKGKHKDNLGWCLGMQALVQFKVLRVGDGKLYRGDCVYLVNHRSWADMLVDQYITEGRAMFLGRVWAKLLRHPSLVAYPEGHRNTGAASLSLKRGMLYYAYSRRLPVQVIIGCNKEAILCEKVARIGQTVAVGYSDVIQASQFESIDGFLEQVQETWDVQWLQVFGAELQGLPELTPGPPDYDYSMAMRALLAVLIPLNILMSLATIYYALCWGASALALLGPPRVQVLLLGSAWVVGSFLQAARPVQALELREHTPATRAKAAEATAKEE